MLARASSASSWPAGRMPELAVPISSQASARSASVRGNVSIARCAIRAEVVGSAVPRMNARWPRSIDARSSPSSSPSAAPPRSRRRRCRSASTSEPASRSAAPRSVSSATRSVGRPRGARPRAGAARWPRPPRSAKGGLARATEQQAGAERERLVAAAELRAEPVPLLEVAPDELVAPEHASPPASRASPRGARGGVSAAPSASTRRRRRG